MLNGRGAEGNGRGGDSPAPVTVEARYARVASAFGVAVGRVPPTLWGASTPCGLWTVRDLVAHVAGNTGVFLTLAGESAPVLPPVDADPAATWRAADREMRAALADPLVAALAFEGYFGPTTFAGAVDSFATFDLIVHRWDLARATGQDSGIGPDDLVRVAAQAREFGAALRRPGICGPALEPPPNADEQTRLLAFLGRAA